MQSTLRIGALIFTAGLLHGSSASATTLKASQHKAGQHTLAPPRVRYLGIASWYGKQHQGRKMADGKRFDREKLTAASWYFPLGTSIRVMNVSNGQSVVVTITDRGPNKRLHRILDLSEAAARQLDYVGAGLTRVLLCPLMTVDTESAAIQSTLIKDVAGDVPVQVASTFASPLP